MICKYKYNVNGEIKVFNSYTELLEYLDLTKIAEGIKDLSDIVFSKERQNEIFSKIKELNLTYIPKLDNSLASSINDEPGVLNLMTVLDFLDTPEFGVIVPYNEEDEHSAFVNLLIERNKNITKEQAEEMYRLRYIHLKTMLKIALSLHPLYTNLNVWKSKGDLFSFIEALSQDIKDELFVNANLTLLGFYLNMKKWYTNSLSKGVIPYSNVNLSSKLEGLDKEIFGHIDYLFIEPDGTLRLYVFKTSNQREIDWTDIKKLRISYLLSFLRRMLQNHKIPVKNIDLNIVPIKVDLNNEGKIVALSEPKSKSYSTTDKGTYRLNSYDLVVNKFIKDNSIPFHISSDPIKKANRVSLEIFLSLHIKEDGIAKSAKSWIVNSVDDYYEGAPLVIKFIGDVNHAYDVKIGDNIYAIKSSKPKNKNLEIENLVKEHINELIDNKSYYINRFKKAILNRLNAPFNTFTKLTGFENSAVLLDLTLLSKYFYDRKTITDKDGNVKSISNWEILPNLLDTNVLIFRHKETNVVDVITLSSFNLLAKASFTKGTNILGDHKRDIEYSDLEGTYGNIEIVKTMNLINEILPELGDVTLGNVGAISTIGLPSLISYNISEFNLRYYQKIIKEINNKDLDILNNFVLAKLQDLRTELITTYSKLTDSGNYAEYEFEKYIAEKSTAGQLKELERIITEILKKYPSYADYKVLSGALLIPGNSYDKDIAVLFELVTRAYLSLRGESVEYRTHLNKLELQHMTATTIGDANIRTVVNNLQITHDTIASEFLSKFDSEIRPKFEEFYKNIGYTNKLNMSYGNLAQLYENFFNWDSDLMSFKNPYDDSNNLAPEERKLLKFVLLLIAQIRSNGNFKYNNIEDPKLKAYITKHPEYLWVPLEKASNATSRLSAAGTIAKMKNFWRLVRNFEENFDALYNNILAEERAILSGEDQNIYTMTLRNLFDSNMPTNLDIDYTIQRRKDMINKYGKRFFETNVENILIDVLAQLISTTQFNKLLVASKALLLLLHITGNFYGNEHITNKEIKYIEDYLKINVFKTSIMSDTEKAVVGTILPIKKVVTDMILGGNVVSMFRDLIEGCELNFIRSVIKLNTNISPKSVKDAYKYVMTHATSDAMAVNLLSKICLKYRISNTDVGRIAERAKSGRNGIYNFDNWLYGTLRHPDFINRMTLFVARCMEDGVWDAFSIDDNNLLKYDWKKDKRFNVYSNPNADKESKEYKYQKSLFLSKIYLYNKEHPDNPIEDFSYLPEPYTNQEIMTIRALGDSIYGSYDRGKKAMNENLAYGVMFGMFTTWMNGLTNVYFMLPLKNNVTRLKKVIALNDKGEKLYFDLHGNILTLAEGGDENMPVWEDEPVIVQGIYYTVKELIRICKNDGFDEVKKYLSANPQELANMKKLISDLLMFLLLNTLFKYAITPAYKDYKKDMKNNPLALNLVTEIFYKASSRSYDLFKGPLNILEFFGENLNPPYYTVPVLVFTLAGEALLGEKSWKYLMFNNTGLTRSIKDSMFAEIDKSGGTGGGSTGGGGASGSY